MELFMWDVKCDVTLRISAVVCGERITDYVECSSYDEAVAERARMYVRYPNCTTTITRSQNVALQH